MKEARDTVNKFIADDIPLDGIVFDLYWFGKEVKGTMGNLAWDKDSFPNPEGMIADFRNKGVQTVVITEPFVVDTSALAGSRRQKVLAPMPRRGAGL
jgi:alpha-glucosidase/oligosaccharide 4-alpha-D-glucosyltransferase